MKQAAILLALVFQVLCVCAQDSIAYRGLTIRHGDLLFVGAQSENLSGAINRVTQRTNNTSFDHIGLIEIAHGQPYILHASSKKGSVKEPLDSLIRIDHEATRLFAIYRIDSIYQNAIPKAIERAHQLLGKPYNWSYTLNDSSYYCSDFVERAFRHIRLFELEPMTFKNPKTGEFDEFWISFYANQGREIPEGELGCNPNGMAANPHIHHVGSFHGL
ncbi:YiiX/YebB-like N1pC/P60 family cysteine hydrolase [Sphingobacterium chuzhouense]|uniref:Permuted papain-like amidase YaeF/Yiix C92 family enzyme n=1 Tax=Sphingobacterium chuzhouense TaxID=1742264 RepID=A0ABR7XUD6_9SPHI|nr:YiiX/YebB-like N1pC/P60 family cysteine hydrolase [Sphingobacterium chuzhouense]MBD1422670.1 hypothetical protein [Sphingobacterium chuzhouense]